MATREEEWPACTFTSVPWRQQVRAGSKADRMVRSIKVCNPPEIANRMLRFDSELASRSEFATGAISSLDSAYGKTLKSLDRLLIRSESISSSKIENLHATSEEYARALYGNNSNSSAVAMVAGTNALTALVASVSLGKPITESAVKKAHYTLMKDVPREIESAGKYRLVQNWIDGSDYSPIGAIFIPPPPENIGRLMQDLLTFANRDDLPVLVQAAVTHAQFETIHPFTDGNGRIGRALVNAILRRRGVTTWVVVPIASFLVADKTAYFEDLNKYRDGSLRGLLSRFIGAAAISAVEVGATAAVLDEIRATWRKKIGTVRTGSSTSQLLDRLISIPVFSAEELVGKIGKNPSSIYNAISKLNNVGILEPLSDQRRNQIWGAVDVLGELEDLNNRIATKGRA